VEKINIALIGCGYWGPNYIRVFNELPHCRVSYCCDLDDDRLSKMKKLYPEIKIAKDYKRVAGEDNIQAVVIATPLNTHYRIAKYFLGHDKHILVEKPLTLTSFEAEDLVKAAKRRKLILMVGHVYEYNPGIVMLKNIIKEGKLGRVYYIKSERMGLGPIRKHANALWDLATHDISVALYLLEELPSRVFAHGGRYIQNSIEDFVDLTLRFRDGVFCSIYASWLAPEKIRKLTVVGSRGMAVFDDVNKAEMLKIYEREINKSMLDSTPDYNDHQHIVRVGDVYTVDIKQSEPMRNQAEDFIKAVLEKRPPKTDGNDGLRVVRILESAQDSLKRGEGHANKKRKAG
jgi:predicted dehydrogenase